MSKHTNRRNRKGLLALAAASALAVGGLSAKADTYYWDTSVDPGYQSGASIWGTDSHWTLDGTNLVAWPGGSHTAAFDAPSFTGTVTVTGTQPVAGLQFTSGTVTLSGGGLELTNAQVNTTVSASVASKLTGTVGFTKAGAGSLTLSGANAYSGTTTVSEGTLVLNSNDAPMLGSAVWLDASSLTAGKIATWTDRSGNNRNATQATAANQPTVVANSLVGGKNVVQFNGTSTFMGVDLSFLVGTNYTIAAMEGRSSNKSNNYFLGTGGASTNTGLHFGYRLDAQFTLAQYGNDTNATVPAYGGQQFNETMGVHSSTTGGTIYRNGAQVGVDATKTGNFTAAASGVIGRGFNATNYYQGDIAEVLIYDRALTVDERTAVDKYLQAKWLGVGAGGAIPDSSTVDVKAGATLDLQSSWETIGGLTGDGGVSIGSAGALTVNNAADTAFAGTINGGGRLYKLGTAKLTLSGANSFLGVAAVGQGTLSVNSIPDGGTNGPLGSGTTVELGSAYGTGTLQYTGGSAATNRSFMMMHATNGGGIEVTDAGATLTLSGAVLGRNVGGPWSAAPLRKTGPGTLRLGTNAAGDVDNSYLILDAQVGTVELNKGGTGKAVAGISNISAGATVKLTGSTGDQIYGASSTGALSLVKMNGGTLDLFGHSESFDRLTGTGTITSSVAGDVTLTLGEAGGSTTVVADAFAGAITDGSGVVTLRKIGAGTISLSGTSSTYSGKTRIEAGTLFVANDGALGALPAAFMADNITLLDGTKLQNFDSDAVINANRGITLSGANANFQAGWSKSLTINGVIAGATNVTIPNDVGTVYFNAVNTYGTATGGMTTIQGKLAVNSDAALGAAANGITFGNSNVGSLTLTAPASSSRNVTLTGNGTISVSTGADSTYSGVISGAGTFTKAGVGKLTITGTNTYTGQTTVSAGTLEGHTLSVRGPINNNAAVTFNQSDAGAYAGTMVGTGSLTKTGAGTLTLNTYNTYAGPTVITSGTLKVQPPSSPPTTYAGAPALVLDARQGVVIDPATGRVSGWNDQTINGRNATMTTAAQQPAVVSNPLLGKPVLRFDGADDYFDANLAFLQNSDYTFFVVEGRTSAKSNNYFLGTNTTGSNNAALHVGYRANNTYTLAHYANDLDYGGIPGYTSQEFRLWSNQLTGTTQSVYLNGVLEGSRGAAKLTNASAGKIGRSYAATGNNYQGDIAAIIAYPSSLSAADRAATENYLMAQWLGILPDASTVQIGAGATLDVSGTTETIGGLADVGTVDPLNPAIVNVEGGTLRVGANNTAQSFSGKITGAGALVKVGTGVQTLTSAESDFNGGVTLAQGTLGVSQGQALGSGNVTFAGGALQWATGATMDLSNRFNAVGAGYNAIIDTNGNNVAFGSPIAGAGGLTKIGAGTLALSVDSEYTGGTTLAGGALAVDADSRLGASAGGINFNGGTLQVTAAGFASSRAVTTLAGGGTLDTNGFDVTLNGVVGGTGRLTKAGAGTLTLANAGNNYTGGITVSAGVLKGDVATLRGPITTNATVNFDQAVDATFSGSINGTGGMLKTGAGTLTLDVPVSYTGTTSIESGTLKLEAKMAPVSGMAMWLDATDAGTLTMDASNYVSQWNDKSGNTRNAAQATVGSKPVYVADAKGGMAAIRFDGAADQLLFTQFGAQTVFIVNRLDAGQKGLAGIIGLNGADKGIRRNNGVWQNPGDGNDFTNPAGSSMYINGVATNAVGENVWHTLAATRAGSQQNLSALGFYYPNREFKGDIGEVLVYSAALTAEQRMWVESYLNYKWFGAANVLPGASTVAINTGATLDINNLVTSVGALADGSAGGGTVSLGTGTLIAGVSNADASFSGLITGDGQLVKAGTGVQTLSGENTYSGGTMLSAGVLQVSAEANLGASTGALTFNGGTLRTMSGFDSQRPMTISAAVGTVEVPLDQASTIRSAIGGTGRLTKTGPGTLTVLGDNTYSGGTTVSAGTLKGDTTSLKGAIANNGNVTFEQAAAGTYAGVMSGTGTLTKEGAETLTLSGNSTYSGKTLINAGTLRVQAVTPVEPTTTGMQLRLDASTAVVDGTNRVTSWTDLSGNNRNATQGTAANQPLLATSQLLGGKPVVRFDGNDNLGVDLSFLSNSAYTFFVVEGRTSNKASNYFLGTQNSGTANNAVHVGYRNDTTYTLDQYGTGLDVGGLPGYSTQMFRLWSNELDTTGASQGAAGHYVYLNGALGNWVTNAATVTTAGGANGRVGVGYGGGQEYIGDLAEIIIYNRAMTPAERAGVEAYLMSKWMPEMSNVIPDASTVSVGATGILDLANASEMVGALEGVAGSQVSLGTGSLIVGYNNNATGTDFAGTISGTGGLVKVGTGVQTLSGISTYSGGTAINGGVLAVSANENLGAASGGLTFNGGTLRTTTAIDANRPITINSGGATIEVPLAPVTLLDQTTVMRGAIGGTGRLTKTGLGTLTVLGDNTYSGGTTVSAGTLKGNTTSLKGAIVNSANVTFDQATAAGTYAGVMSGTGTLTKEGPETLTLSGNNTYAGKTLINAGTLKVQAPTLATGAMPTGMQLWLDASTLTAGSLAMWTDQSGNTGRDATQANGVNQPTVVSNNLVGTKSVVRFDGNDVLNVDLTYLANSGYTFFVVEGRSSSKIQNYFLGTENAGSANNALHVGYRADTNYTLDQYSNSVEVTGLPGYSLQTFRLWSNELDTTGTSVGTAGHYVYLNGKLAGQSTNAVPLSATGAQNGRIGLGYSANGTYNYAGELAEIIVYHQALTPAERADVENYLMSKWMTGVSNVIPDASTVSIAATGTLDLDNSIETVGGLEGLAGAQVTMGSGSLIVGGNNTNTDFAGVISGTGGVTKVGTGILALSGASSFTGGLRIANGAVAVSTINDYSSDGPLGGFGVTMGGQGTTGTLRYTGADLETSRSFTVEAPGGGGFFVENAVAKLTLNSAVVGAGSVTKSGPGTLVLAVDNYYQGGTTVSAGTLQIGNGGFGGSVDGNIVNNATVVFNRDGDFTVSNNISGTGQVKKLASGTMTLIGTNTYTGGTLVSAGAVRAAVANLPMNGAIAVEPNAAMVFDQYTTAVFRGNMANAGTVVKDSYGTLVLAGVNSGTGDTRINAGTLIPATPTALGSGGIEVASGATLALSKPGLMSEFYSGFDYAAHNNLDTLNARLNAKLAAVTELASGDINYGNATFPAPFANANTFEGRWVGRILIPATGTYGFQTTSDDGSMLFIDGAVVVNNNNGHSATTVSGSATLTAGYHDIVISFTEDGGEASLKAEMQLPNTTNWVTLNGTHLSYGTLNLSATKLTGAGQVELGASALQLTSPDDFTFDGTFSGTGSVTKTGAGEMTLTGESSSFSGSIAVTAGKLRIGGGEFSFIGGIGGASIVNNGEVIFDRNGELTLSGAISGSGIVRQAGSSTSTTLLSGVNTYAGGTVIENGTLALGAAGALPSGGDVNVAGFEARLDLRGYSATIGALIGSGSVDSTVAADPKPTLTIQSGDFGGILQGDFGLVKAGPGELRLACTSGYTGNTVVEGGTLRVVDAASLPTSGSVTNSATLLFEQAFPGGFAGDLKGPGEFIKTEAGVLTFSGAMSLQDGARWRIQGGEAVFEVAAASGLTGSARVDVHTGAKLTLQGGNDAFAGGQASIYTNGELLVTGARKTVSSIQTAPALAGGVGLAWVQVGMTSPGELEAGFVRAKALSIGDDSAVLIKSGGVPAGSASQLDNISIAPTGKLDLSTKSLVLEGMPLESVRLLARSGLTSGYGITSSAAAADPDDLHGLAVFRNTGSDGQPIVGNVDGLAVDGDSVIVKYALYGDSNFDNQVTATDYFHMDRGYLASAAGAAINGTRDGDLNYDGVVNADDYGLVDWAFLHQSAKGGRTGGVTGSAVPEPGTLGLLALGAVGLLSRRRRRS